MSLLDDISRGVKNVADTVSDGASKHAMKSDVRDAEQALWQVYAQMGYRALELVNEGAIKDEKLSELAGQVAERVEHIEGLKAQIEALDGPEPEAAAPQADPASPIPQPSPTPSPSTPEGMETVE